MGRNFAIVFLIIILFDSLLHAQDYKKLSPDSILKLMDDRISISDGEGVLALADSIDDNQEFETNPLYRAKLDTKIANAHYLIGNFKESVQYYQGAYFQFGDLKETKLQAETLYNLQSPYFSLGQTGIAISALKKSISLFKESSDTVGICKALTELGNIYWIENMREKGESILQFALSIAIKSRNIEDILPPLYGLSAMYLSLKDKSNEVDLKKAEQVTKLGLKIAESIGNEFYATRFSFSMSSIHMQRKEFDKAEERLTSLLKIARNLKAISTISWSLAELYSTLQNYELFQYYLKLAYLYGKETKVKQLLINPARTLYYIELEKGNYYEALKYYRDYAEADYAMLKQKSVQNLQVEESMSERMMIERDLTAKAELAKVQLSKQVVIRNVTILALLMAMIAASMAYYSYRVKRADNRIIAIEKDKSEKLLLNILPKATADELKKYGKAKAQKYESVSVVFTDFKGFTTLAEQFDAEHLVAEIDHCFSEFDKIIARIGIEKIKTIGDAYMCVAGLPEADAHHAEKAVKAALEICKFMDSYILERKNAGLPYFEIRIGIHSGPVVAGIVGISKFAYDIWGDTVNTASRMESSGEVGRVNISGSTYKLIQSKFHCTYRGKIQAKGKGEIDMYFVDSIIA
jgi:class 3 adenylate cyclase